MPGTIQVSVLYLMDLPSPSNSISRETNLVSVKVFMGKREYQTWGKEDFSFPLISLREKLIVVLNDVEGNEITRKDFETKSVVEKGFWDDLFIIEGWGQIIVKFRFSLSEDERKRIRHMRETVLKKKKHEEFLKSGVSRSKSVNDLQESVVRTKNVKFSDELVEHSAPIPVWHPIGTQSGPESREETPIDRVDQRAPDGREPSSTAPLLEEKRHTEHLPECNALHLTEANYFGSERTLETGSPTTDIPQRKIASQEALDPRLGCVELIPSDKTTQRQIASQEALDPQLGRVESIPADKITQRQIASEEALDPQLGRAESIPADKITKNSSLVSSLPEEDKARTIGPETSPKKVPSSVRKMISAFETSVPQGQIARVNPTTKLLSNKIERDGSLKGTGVEDLGTITNKAMQNVAEKREETTRPQYLKPKNSYVAAGLETVRKDKELLVYKTQEFELNPRLQKTFELMDHQISSKESLNVEGMTNVLKPIATKETDILRGSVENVRKNQDSLFGVHHTTSMHEGDEAFEEKIRLDGRKEDPVDSVAQTVDGSSYGTRLSQLSDQFEILAAESNPAKHISSNEDRIEKDVTFDVVHKKPTTNVKGDFSEDLTDGVTETDAKIPGEMLDEPADTDQPHSLCTDLEDSSLNTHLDRGWRICRDDSDNPSTCQASDDKQKLVRCPLVNPCSWILPNEARHLCITTASKQLRDLVECCGIYIETHLSEMTLSSMEATEHIMCVDASIAMNKDDKASCNLRTAKLKSSIDASKIIGGLIAQFQGNSGNNISLKLPGLEILKHFLDIGINYEDCNFQDLSDMVTNPKM